MIFRIKTIFLPVFLTQMAETTHIGLGQLLRLHVFAFTTGIVPTVFTSFSLNEYSLLVISCL